MRKQESNQIIKRKQRIISALLQDMVKWGEKERQETVHKEINRTVQLQTQNSVSFEFDKTFEKKDPEEAKSIELLSQSPISGKPSPFIGSIADLQIIKPKAEPRAIRNKSVGTFCESTIFLENRYRKLLEQNKIQCNYELLDIIKKISKIIPEVSVNSYSWNFLKKMCKIIGDFIENNDLHNDTDQLISIIMKFDDTKQSFVNALSISSNNIEKEEFCKKTLCRIRYIFSKLGRLLNLREQTNKWLVKDNNRLLKLISKANPNFVNEMKVKKLQLVNMDSHENKNAKLELLFFFKKLMAKWKNDVDYEILKRNEVPYV